MRRAAFALAAAGAGAGASAACGSAGDATVDAAGESTFGLEVAVAVKGRGRVVSDPTALDCPSSCFARVLLTHSTLDGSDQGLSLRAEASAGSHFAGWTYESMELGLRGRGPAECSPMKRWTLVPPTPSPTARLALHYAETAGTPPPGQEAECAAFTTVPVAYAVTATFEEDTVGRGGPAPFVPPVEVLFEPPALGSLVGREIGLMGGRVYWRFDRIGVSGGTASGIASGDADGKGGGSIVVVPPTDAISRVDLDRHLVLQHSNGLVETVTRSGARAQLTYFSQCAALASDEANAYCRIQNGGSAVTYLYSWPIGGGSTTYLYTLPRGNDLAVDEDRVYFSDDQGGLLQGEAVVESAPRSSDGGGIPTVTKLVFGQTSPRDLLVGSQYLFWLDDSGGNLVDVVSALKTGDPNGLGRGLTGARFVAKDPSSASTFWIGISNPGESYILRATALSTNVTTFRTGLTGLGGVAVSDSHVYWTQSDGRVYRAPKD